MKRERVEEGIYKRGSRYQAIVMAPTATGRRKQTSTMARTLAEARKKRRELLVDAATRNVPAIDARTTTRTLVESWIEHRKQLGKIRLRTEQRYREVLARDAWPSVGHIAVQKLNAMHLQAVVDEAARRGVDPRQTIAVLRAALGQAVRWKLIPYSPADGVELPHHRRPELTVPTHDELERLLAGAGDLSDPFRAALTICAACGLRRSEVAGLRWSDVDLDESALRVRRGIHAIRRKGGVELVTHEPKSDRGRRTVEIPAAAARVLAKYRAAQAERRVVLGEAWAVGWEEDVVIDDGLGRPVNPDAITRRFDRLRERVGVRREVRLHDLRALYVTEALAAGVDAGIVSRQAGHSSANFTRDVYQRVRHEDARAAADAIDRALGDAFSASSVDTVLTPTRATVVRMNRPRR